MDQHLNFSWEIMPQLDLLWTGDVNIDASFFLIVRDSHEALIHKG